MIVFLSGRSLLCAGLAGRLGLENWPVVMVPLATSISHLAATVRRLNPQVLIVDASDIRDASLLFLDALRAHADLADCPVLIIAGGSLCDGDTYRAAAQARGIHVLLEAVSFEELLGTITSLMASREAPPRALAV